MNEPVLPKASTSAHFRRPYIGRNSHYIVTELCAVLQQQMDALAGGGLNDFSETELSSYRQRQEKIRGLRKELGDFAAWASQ
jgi:hypothetical protein